MPYRTNAKKDDMIVELEESEIKKACLNYIRDAYDLYTDSRSLEDVTVSYDKATASIDPSLIRVRIQMPKLAE